MKTVYIEPAWKQVAASQLLLSYPPEGYRFVTKESPQERLSKVAAKASLAYGVQGAIGSILPLNLIKANLERFRRIPEGVDLTYSAMHLVLREEPWVLDMMTEPCSLLVWNERQLRRHKGVLQRALASEKCRRIICWIESGRTTFLSTLNCRGFEQKLEVVPGAVPRKDFVKRFNEDRVRLLFVNSANIGASLHFEGKGGKELLEAFLQLNRKYDNLELVIRSALPQALREKYRSYRNIRIIDQFVPWTQLDEEWKSADVFVLPTYSTPAMVFLDAMSYELPVVATDLWGNPDIIEHGKTGFLIPETRKPRFNRGFVVVDKVDPNTVEALVTQIGTLIEDKELRRRLGRAGREEVDHGKFSIEKRNERLKRILDEATA